jgi:AsmA protein
MKWIKRILAGVVILVLLLVGAAVAFVATFDPNDYKQRAETAVEQATGRELALTGDIELSFFPWLGVKLGTARLGNAEGFGPEPFMRVENVQVRVAVLPLFRGEVQADTVRLVGLEANLSRNAQGQTNWDDLMKGKDQPAPQKKPTQQTGRGGVLAVGGIEIEDAAVHWQDAQSGTDLRIAPVNLSTSALAFGKPFDIDLALRLINAKPAIAADVALTSKATIDQAMQRFALADMKLTVNARGKQLPSQGIEASLESTVNADLKAGTATVKPLVLRAADLQLTGQVVASDLSGTARIEGALNSNAFSPRELAQALGQALPPTRDPHVLDNATLKLAFNASPDSAEVSRLEAQVDDTRLNGKAAIESFEKPKISFVAVLDVIDLDRYQPPKAQAEQRAGKPAPPADDRVELPVEALRDLHLDGRIKAGKLKASNLTLTDLKAKIMARDGLVEVTPLNTNLYQGRLQGNATMDLRGDTPTYTLDSALSGLQAGAFLTQLAGDEYLTGTTGLTLDLKTRGRSMSVLKQALNGNLVVNFKEGSIANSELAGRISRAIAFFKGQPDAPADAQTQFTSLAGSAQVARGVLNNSNLSLISPEVLAQGQGQINLVESMVDYTLNVALNDQGKPKDDRFVPIEVSGPFSNLGYKLALTDVVKEEAEQAVTQELEEQELKLKDKLQEELGDELKNLKDQFNL